jgi:hypothetical protein
MIALMTRRPAVLTTVLALGFTACGRIWYTPILSDAAEAGTDRDGGGDARGAVGGAIGAGGTSGAGGMSGVGGGVAVDGSTGDAGINVGAGAPCSSSSYGGHVYTFCDSPLDWSTAMADCELKGMHLLRIDDAQENAFIEGSAFGSVAAGANQIGVWRWLGADDQAVVGEWRWTDGTLFWVGGSNGTLQPGTYANWGGGQPNGAGGLGNHCASIEHDPTGDWGAEACTNQQSYVCEQ